jgi:Glycosyl hydrolase family 26
MFALLAGSASAASPGRTLGVYAGSGAPAAVARFEAGVGRPVAVVYDAFARESWSAMTNVDWWAQTWNASQYRQRIVYTVPMLPDTGGSLAAGAAGSYNSYFRTIAEKLVANGEGAATLRLGHEFNGNWYKWSINVPNGAADFGAYWRQIVTTMRSVAGANFTFDWCANAGSTYVNGAQLNAEAAYPGDAYVDYIGMDIYDASWVSNRQDPDARWKGYVETGNGLRWHRDFAKAMGKPMTFPEWGIANRFDGHGGGDSPEFVEKMHAWISANDVAYHMYFEFADAAGDYAIFNGKNPRAATRFKELFANDNLTGSPSRSTGIAAPS